MDVMRIETKLGTILVRNSGCDEEHPGIWIDLHRPGADSDAPLALIEFVDDEADIDGQHIITRVWGDVNNDEYSERIVHENIEKFFETV